MNRTILTIIAVLVVLCAALGYFSYKQTQRNGELQTTLDIANAASKQWSEAYDQLNADLTGRQSRLDEAINRAQALEQNANEQSKLFRTEIDSLKRTNNELRQLLDSRIPNSLLISLCARNYASPAVCQGLL